jgi:hypothetical protein
MNEDYPSAVKLVYDKSKRALPEMGIQPRSGFKNGQKRNAPRFRGFSHEMEAGEHEDAKKAFHSNGAKPRKPRRIRISRFL